MRKATFGHRLVPPLTRCRGCQAPIVWRRTEAGRWMPCNPDGTPHWATCPKAEAFRRLRRRRDFTRAAPGRSSSATSGPEAAR